MSLDAERWQRLWQARGAEPPVGRFAALQALYAEPGRHYHGAAHIRACLAALDELHAQAVDVGQVELAIWYHDAIYDTARQDNETRSAELAELDLREVGLEEDAKAVAALILATDHRHAPATDDQRLLVDIDLSILGAPWPVYQVYAEAVRREYARFPDALYRPGRVAVLRQFLQRPAIFTTPAGQARWETTARSNLLAEIQQLEA